MSNIPNSGNIPVYRSALMENSHQTQGGKFGANPALSRNCNEIIASLSQDARRFVYNHVFHLRGMDDGEFIIFLIIGLGFFNRRYQQINTDER